MAISKDKKVKLLEAYVEQLQRSRGIILAEFRGLTMANLSDIRNAVRPLGGKVQVVKNRLLLLALRKAGLTLPEEWLSGPLVIGFCYDEVPPVVKLLVDAAKELEGLTIRGGMLGTSAIAAEQVRAIADLPSREALLAQVLGTINAPASQVVGVVASGIRQVLNVLQAYVDKLEGAGVAPAVGQGQAAEPASA